MKRWVWLLLCSNLILGWATTSTVEPTIAFAMNANWPEDFHFCQQKVDGSGQTDCWHIQSVEDWLALESVQGETIPTWLESGSLPLLPKGLTWDYTLYRIKYVFFGSWLRGSEETKLNQMSYIFP
jgi:hypothetical protein